MKKILLFFLIVSVLFSIGIVSGNSNKSNFNLELEGHVVESDNINYEAFLEIGKKIRFGKEKVHPRDLSPTFEQLDPNRYNALVVQLNIGEGLELAKAKQRALESVIQEVALMQAALTRGIVVSEEESIEMAQKNRDLLENSAEKTYGLDARKAIENLIVGLGITEDEYWNEVAVISYKQLIMLKRLNDEVLKDADPGKADKIWAQFIVDTVKDFKNKKESELQRFKSSVGIKSQ